MRTFQKSMRFSVVALFYLVLAGALTGAIAQSLDRTPKYYTYKVKQGDSLNFIIGKYLIDGTSLNQLLEVNPNIDQTQLQPGQLILLPRPLIRFTVSEAVVSRLRCDDQVYQSGSAVALKPGSIIRQGDIIKIPPRCDVSLQFEDRSTVRMPSGGSIEVRILRHSLLEKSPEVELRLLNGSVHVKVPKRQGGDAPFEINTPNSVAGVRGTDFRVSFDQASGSGKLEVSSGLVAAQGAADALAAKVGGQKGVVIPKTGLADPVEDLPEPIRFVSAQVQKMTGWDMLVFAGSPNSAKYFLKEGYRVNGPIERDTIGQDEPVFVSTNLGPTAKILIWSAQTQSGLMGDERVFALCRDRGGLTPNRCNVRFDIEDLQDPLISIFEELPSGKSINILNAYRPAKDAKELILKALPEGVYFWQIRSTVDGSIAINQEGRFELISASSN